MRAFSSRQVTLRALAGGARAAGAFLTTAACHLASGLDSAISHLGVPDDFF